MIRFWGLSVGLFRVTWYDLSTRACGIEISRGTRTWICRGF